METRSHKESTALSEEKAANKSFKDLVQNFMEYTTAHGIGRLAASQTLCWKIFWSLVCIGAFGMFTFQAMGLFEQYFSKPVATSVSVTFEKVCLNELFIIFRPFAREILFPGEIFYRIPKAGVL